MINLDNVNNRPVIIVSSPRTGSTVLGHYIKDKLGYKFYDEPTSYQNKRIDEFFKYESRYKNWVLKEHAWTFARRYFNDIFEKNAYVIRLRRRNLFDQVLSGYIGISRNKFNYKNGEKFQQDTIPLDNERLIYQLNFALDHNLAADIFRYPIDDDLFYEDLDFGTGLDVTPTPRPKNYDELVLWAKDILKDKV